MSQIAAEDLDAIRTIHQDYAEGGFVTGVGAKQAARDVAETNEALAMFLVERANEMDRPVTVDDIMASVAEWFRR